MKARRSGVKFAFKDFVLDPDRRELRRGTATVSMGPQVFDLLLYLVENRDRVVSKDDLLEAVWGGRIVSESTLTSHINAVRKAVGDTGNDQHVIRTVARKGVRFIADVQNETELATIVPTAPIRPELLSQASPVLPDKPSIAVLAFTNMSADPDHEYFADGVVEDVINALSRIQWLFVIARNSSFVYKGRAVDVKQVGRELGVRYVLEGSVRRFDNRVRITGQLIDATTGPHLWAERFDGSLDDIFALQDQVATSVAGAIAPQLERAEIERAQRKPTESLTAYDFYLRGRAHLNQGSREAIDQALPWFNRAIESDPLYASAYAMAAWCHLWRKVNGWMVDPESDIAEGTRLARQAIELGRDDVVALTRGGHALAHFVDDLSTGVALLDRALVMNPNHAAAWFLGGYLRVWLGETEGALEHFNRAMRLSPLDPEVYRMRGGIAAAHLFAHRFDDAVAWAERASQNLPSFLLLPVVLAAAHAHAGRVGEARQAAHRLQQLNPGLRISNLRAWLPIHRPQDLATFAVGLRLAGVPE